MVNEMKDVWNGVTFRSGRWVKRHTDYNITEKHPLWTYAEDCGDGTFCVDYFINEKRKVAVGALMARGGMAYYDAGHEPPMINCYDADSNLFHPLYGEVSSDGEQCRFWHTEMFINGEWR